MDKYYCCYIEKRPGFDVCSRMISAELSEFFGILGVTVRLFNRYDIWNFKESRLRDIVNIVLSEPMSDICYEYNLPLLPDDYRVFAVESLPGQFNARADSCEQCIQMLCGGMRPVVRTALIYAVRGVNSADFERIKSYLVNPLESRTVSPGGSPLIKDMTVYTVPDTIEIIDRFIYMNDNELGSLRQQLGFAMSEADLCYTRAYFQKINRNPTITELRVIDTYWSDHCRHTTFNTIIQKTDIRDKRVKEAFDLFLSINGSKPITLMNIATAAMRHLHKTGGLPRLDISDENNACTVRIDDNYLLFFKNETHNHPTEIEPFGGASTCIGGAIRDPLSGRAYVYQAMRITGAGDPGKSLTLPGKLPQRKLTTTAALGFSSYGNQIGLATGLVKELYHDGYIAKRLEAGAVVGAALAAQVRREPPVEGDVVVLLGGRTGRDGIGGATGSSKIHADSTVSESAAEVQKGNAPEERKLQRLFRNPQVTRLIKRCNDFGAGGAAVAIGELADGVEINLDAFLVKYRGLDGTELAISESQERMAAVVSSADANSLIKYAEDENIEAAVVAEITNEKFLAMRWKGRKIVDISREFLDTNGAARYTDIYVDEYSSLSKILSVSHNTDIREHLLKIAADINFCSQKGLVEHFDSTIGANSVFMPFGGKYALSEMQVMAALLPYTETQTASVMAYGFDPYLTAQDPFAGSVYAVISSAAKLISVGVRFNTIYLSLQEYFPRVNDDPARWGLPFTALLGAFSAQMGLGLAAIGGKDSMSGSFGDKDVPPTLISFAVGTSNAAQLVSTDFKGVAHPVYLLEIPLNLDKLPDYTALKRNWEAYTALCLSGNVLSAWVCEAGGVCGGIIKMSFGNMIGFKANFEDLFEPSPGSIIFESAVEIKNYRLLGYTQQKPTITVGEADIPLSELISAWESPLENVFPTRTEALAPVNYNAGYDLSVKPYKESVTVKHTVSKQNFNKPKAVIPVFPGTNCEYDTQAAVERAGGVCEIVLIRNISPKALELSVTALSEAIKTAQMLILPGGFSGGDEPDGSGKFIVSLFRNQYLTETVNEFLENKDGLILGICNGFQALVKLGLLPHGRISPVDENSPTLTYNSIGRHQSRYVLTRVSSCLSPWFSKCAIGDIYTEPVSHGEGRFVASAQVLDILKTNGQIAAQYVDYDSRPTMDIAFNPNGSVLAIEAITDKSGRVLGKMAHTERFRERMAKNIQGNKNLPLFEGGVNYFN